MGHTPFGYRIENGIAVIDKDEAGKLRKLYENYLSGLSLKDAAAKAGIDTYHGTAKRLLKTQHYIGDDFYPAIIDEMVFQNAQVELVKEMNPLVQELVRKPLANAEQEHQADKSAVAEQPDNGDEGEVTHTALEKSQAEYHHH